VIALDEPSRRIEEMDTVDAGPGRSGDNWTSVYIRFTTAYDGWYAIAECRSSFATTGQWWRIQGNDLGQTHGSPRRMSTGVALRDGGEESGMHDDTATIDHGSASIPAVGSGRSTDRRDAPVFQSSSSTPDPALARFYMTSDLRAATNLTRTHLDFYLREGVIVPTARTESGYLLFDDGELGTLRQVIAWRQDGVGIREIRARLNRSRPGEDVMNDVL